MGFKACRAAAARWAAFCGLMAGIVAAAPPGDVESKLPEGIVLGKMPKADHGLIVGLAPLTGAHEGKVEVYIVRPEKGLNKEGWWTLYQIGLKNGLHGEYRLTDANGKDVPIKTPVGVSPQLSPKKFETDLHRKERRPIVFIGDMREYSLQYLIIPKIFAIPKAGDYTLHVRPYVWEQVRKGLPGGPFKLPGKLEPATLTLTAPASWITETD